MTSLDEAFAPLAPEEVSQPSRCRNQTTWRAILPIPADAPQPSSELVNNCAPAGYSATDQWWYRDPEGRPLGLWYATTVLQPAYRRINNLSLSPSAKGRMAVVSGAARGLPSRVRSMASTTLLPARMRPC